MAALTGTKNASRLVHALDCSPGAAMSVLSPASSAPARVGDSDPTRRIKFRIIHGRKTIATSPLFPSYLFIKIELQWSGARSCPGVAELESAPEANHRKFRIALLLSYKTASMKATLNSADQKPVSGIAWDGKGMVHVRAGPFLGFTGLAKGTSGPRACTGATQDARYAHAQSNFPSVMLFHFSCGLFR